MGAYPVGAFMPVTTGEMSPGVYTMAQGRVPGLRGRDERDADDGAYRGAGRPEAAALVERAVDLVAAELGLDPVEIRRRNLIASDAFPYRTATGTTYDTGDYARVPRRGAPARRLRRPPRRAARASRPRRPTSCWGSGSPRTSRSRRSPRRSSRAVEVTEDGTVLVRTGTSPHGQGHETAFAQLAAGMLAVPMEAVQVLHSDTGIVAQGQGTWGSRSLQAGGSSIAIRAERGHRAGTRRSRRRALEVDAADLEGPVDGGFRVTGAPDRAVSWAALAGAAAGDGGLLVGRRLPRDPGSTFPFGAHVAVVEVDVETGGVTLVRHDRRRRLRADPQPAARARPAARRDGAGHRAGAVRGGPSTTRRAIRSPAPHRPT